mmetsp:Transcript_11444/g.32141  ORF Transcript_11444/g.32141 Transcript_11444/m.32141 type:complete len:226 (+) Transcript_11444:77-754(+)|eukprot:CAMPEP_0119130308 /NCGR_PEP_ID=MMETSP1310-20130426/7698_1 /TAXON_ID=464262 /ORGANISM="Genus nov. species nov., Strain RCC2339" /LENGTH=225 /DNA_ID=CAMNT_0007120807 /DNA_START=53 /DNA_END=730 /DNA_ORIENTATION=+
MSRWFGTKKEEAPPPTLSDVNKRIDARVVELDKKIRYIDDQLLHCRKQLEQRQTPAASNRIRQRARQLLSERKMYDSQREKMIGSSMNVAQTEFTMQAMRDTQLQVEAMRAANDTMKVQMKEMNIDDMYKLQDQLEDMMDIQNEFQEVMCRSHAVPEDIDDAELEAELAMLQEMPEMADSSATPSYATALDPTAFPAASHTTPSQDVDEYGLPIGGKSEAAPLGF